MSKIYVGQDVTITLETNVSLGAATTLEIRAKPPNDGDVVTKTASVVSGTSASADFEDTDLTVAGVWRFQVYAVISDKKRFGETFKYTVTDVYL